MPPTTPSCSTCCVTFPTPSVPASVLALVRHADDPLPILCEGLWPGRILYAAQGEHGFGYDPLFQPDGEAVSAAELAPAEKNQRSHRARAMAQLKQRLGL